MIHFRPPVAFAILLAVPSISHAIEIVDPEGVLAKSDRALNGYVAGFTCGDESEAEIALNDPANRMKVLTEVVKCPTRGGRRKPVVVRTTQTRRDGSTQVSESRFTLSEFEENRGNPVRLELVQAERMSALYQTVTLSSSETRVDVQINGKTLKKNAMRVDLVLTAKEGVEAPPLTIRLVILKKSPLIAALHSKDYLSGDQVVPAYRLRSYSPGRHVVVTSDEPSSSSSFSFSGDETALDSPF